MRLFAASGWEARNQLSIWTADRSPPEFDWSESEIYLKGAAMTEQIPGNGKGSEVIQARTMTLFFIQLFGCLFSSICIIWLNTCAIIDQMRLIYIVASNGFICLFLLMFHKRYGAKAIEELIQRQIPSLPKVCRLDFSTLLPTYALMDLISIGMCMFGTGGSQQSVFTPLLLTIVPVMITLRERSWVKVGSATVGTIVVLLATLRHHDGSFQPRFVVGTNQPVAQYMYCYFYMTVLCTTFPAVVFVIQQSGRVADEGQHQ